jgi:hypothetical protein
VSYWMWQPRGHERRLVLYSVSGGLASPLSMSSPPLVLQFFFDMKQLSCMIGHMMTWETEGQGYPARYASVSRSRMLPCPCQLPTDCLLSWCVLGRRYPAGRPPRDGWGAQFGGHTKRLDHMWSRTSQLFG